MLTFEILTGKHLSELVFKYPLLLLRVYTKFIIKSFAVSEHLQGLLFPDLTLSAKHSKDELIKN